MWTRFQPFKNDDDSINSWLASILIFGTMVSSTLLIPAVRPFVASLPDGTDGAMHAFMSVNMLGAIFGAPLVAIVADRTGARRTIVLVCAILDGLLLAACTLNIPVALILALRTLQGAANVGGLSILLGSLKGSGDRAAQARAMSVAGGAMMAAVAAGAPIGVAALQLGPTAPLLIGAAIQLMVAAVVGRLTLPARRSARLNPMSLLRTRPLLKLPTAWIAAERFTVGCFVVTFALYARRAHGLSDTEVGVLFSWFLIPFALAMYPLGRLSAHLDRSVLVVSGTLVYAMAFLSLGAADPAGLPVLMCLCGLAAAAIYAPSLCFAATLAPPQLRSTSMALVNAGGSLGMMLGTALAGIGSKLLLDAGWGPDEAYPAIFRGAAFVELLVLMASSRGLRALSTEPATPRASILPEPLLESRHG